MAEIIDGGFGPRPSPDAPPLQTFGEAAGMQVALRRIEAPYGDELQVTVDAEALSVPRVVAVVLANAAGEDEADRIGKAVLKALQYAESLTTSTPGM